MAVYIDNQCIKYYVDGKFHEKLNLFSVDFSTTYTDCRFPDEKRKQLSVNLVKSELDSLIAGLIEIRDGSSDK